MNMSFELLPKPAPNGALSSFPSSETVYDWQTRQCFYDSLLWLQTPTVHLKYLLPSFEAASLYSGLASSFRFSLKRPPCWHVWLALSQQASPSLSNPLIWVACCMSILPYTLQNNLRIKTSSSDGARNNAKQCQQRGVKRLATVEWLQVLRNRLPMLQRRQAWIAYTREELFPRSETQMHMTIWVWPTTRKGRSSAIGQRGANKEQNKRYSSDCSARSLPMTCWPWWRLAHLQNRWSPLAWPVCTCIQMEGSQEPSWVPRHLAARVLARTPKRPPSYHTTSRSRHGCWCGPTHSSIRLDEHQIPPFQ